MFLSFMASDSLFFEHALSADVTRDFLAMHIHHVASVASDIFQFGTAFFARVSFYIRMRQDVIGDLFLGFESLAAKLADLRSQIRM